MRCCQRVSLSAQHYYLQSGARLCYQLLYALTIIHWTKPATRQLVRNAIRELDYHPNTVARNLKANETRMTGYAWYVAEDPIRRKVPLLDLSYTS